MPAYEFTLYLNRPPTDPELNDLFEAGCDDATFGVVKGVAHVDFHRTARSKEAAITSAQAAVQSVGGLKVVSIVEEKVELASRA